MLSRLPDVVVGALAGFAAGVMGSMNLAFLGLDVAGWPVVGFGVVGAGARAGVGALVRSPVGRARAVGRWSAGMAAAVGVVGFLAGFVGPMVLRPDLPQGPLLGIFCTGPLGVVGGAVLGAIVGLVVPAPASPPVARPTTAAA